MRHLNFIAIIFLLGCSSIKIHEAERFHTASIAGSTHHKYLVGNNTDVVYRLFKFKGSRILVSPTDTLEWALPEKNTLEVVLHHAGQVTSKAMKGRYIDKEFRLKQQVQVRLLPPIVWTFRDDAYSFLLDKEGRLLIYNNSSGSLFITLLPLPATTTGQNRHTLEKAR